jgi:prepilin-type N-terminal cleavage/methylation domain-containing protein
MSDRIHSNTAFTLVEILIVCAIIGILSSIAFPALAAARRAAARAACTSALRQVGTAFNCYTTDFHGTYPHEDNGNTRPPFGSGWYIVLREYTDDRKALICPSAQNSPEYYSYKMNSRLESEHSPFFRAGTCFDPARTVLVFDGRIDNRGGAQGSQGNMEYGFRPARRACPVPVSGRSYRMYQG